jgi:EmrB/QacA subfamily drug resistance transporter
MITRVFPPAERVRAGQVMIVPMLLAPALGPVIGGALVDGLSWRWIFYINLPVGIVTLLVGLLFLPGGSEHSADRFDLPGFLLAATGFSLVMYALETGSSSGWGSAATVGTLFPGLVLLAAFLWWERRVAEPLLRLRLYKDRLYRDTTLQLMFAGGGFIGTLFLVPLLLQNGLGFSALHSGLSTFTEALGGMAGVQLSSALYKRVGPRRLMVLGACMAVAAIGLLSLAGPSNAFWLVPLLMFFAGFSFGFSTSPSRTANMATVTKEETGHASTLVNTAGQVGNAAGVALLSTIIASTGVAAGDLGGYRLSFLVAAGLVAVSVVLSFLVNDADAAPTMAPVQQAKERLPEAV